MIAKLTGIIDTLETDFLILDVHGVGYQVFASAKTLGRLPGSGEKAALHIESLVRQEQTQLFGFDRLEDIHWFRLLLTVQGVGARVALAILSVLTSEEIGGAIAHQDRATIGRADGVGPKLASRILAELKDKGNPWTQRTGPILIGEEGNNLSESISALVNLGYKRPEVAEALAAIVQQQGPQTPTATLIKLGLSALSKRMINNG